MTGAISSEIRKFFTTRMWWGMAIAVVVAGGGFATLFSFLLTSEAFARSGPNGAPAAPMTELSLATNVFTAGIPICYLMTLAVGVMMIGSEYRHKTVTATFLAVPRRIQAMSAKVITLMGIGAFYGLLSVISSVIAGALVLSAKGHHPFADPTIWRTIGLSLLVTALWALIGLGVGILIPNQVAALLISIGVSWIVLPIATTLLSTQSWGRTIAPYFPNEASSAILGASSGPASSTNALVWWAGALVLTGYAAVMAAIGSARTVRADIS